MPRLNQLMSRRHVGMALVALSAASYGCNPIFVKVALHSHAGVPTLLTIRYGLAGVLLTALMYIRGEYLPRGRDLWTLVVLGALGNTVHSGLYLLALANTSAASASIILFVYPALATMMSATILKEKVPPRKLLALIMALAGAGLTVGKASGAVPLGCAYAFGSALWFAGYIVASSLIAARASTLAATTVVVWSSTVIFGSCALAVGMQPPLSPLGWAAASGTAVIGTVVAILAFFSGLNRVGPVITSTLGTVEPIVTVTLAALLLHERLVPLQLLGGSLVLGAIALLARPDTRHAPPLALEP